MTPAENDLTNDAPVMPDTGALRLRVAHVAQANTVLTASDGDLWPSAWADDDGLYAAAGDGTGFARHGWSDILVHRIDGTPETGLAGRRLADGDDVAPIWDPARCNRKPTGIVAVPGDHADTLYLAVQDLRCGEGPDTFNEAPSATIVRSDDRGRTWTWGPRAVFTAHVFTTIMFLDLGRSNGGSDWVYAYGIDGNWRTSLSRIVEDPTRLWLARVPASSVLDRTEWRFFAGIDATGSPTWSPELAERVPVLEDERRFYPTPAFGMAAHDFTCIAQGSVVWNAGLGRYLYSTWSEYTFEFFEAPAPWGPWRHLHSHDFGHVPWHGPLSPLAKHGGYAPTIPSKFISADGTRMWLQSNWFVPASSRGGRAYCFGLREVVFDPGSDAVAPASGGNLARKDAWPLVTRVREGQEVVLNDGRRDVAEDSAFGPGLGEDVWGYEWRTPRRMSRLVYAPGPQDSLGGWFAQGPRVEVRLEGRWAPVDATPEPPYPNDHRALEYQEYVFRFAPVIADGIRLIGTAGGAMRYTSIAELEVWED